MLVYLQQLQLYRLYVSADEPRRNCEHFMFLGLLHSLMRPCACEVRLKAGQDSGLLSVGAVMPYSTSYSRCKELS